MGEAGSKPGTKDISTFVRDTFVEQGRETAFVHLARTEVKPSLQFNPFDCAIRRHKLPLRNEIGDVLDDRCSFREQGAIVKDKRGHVPERIYTSEIAATRNGLRMFIDLNRLEWEFRFAKNDMREQRR